MEALDRYNSQQISNKQHKRVQERHNDILTDKKFLDRINHATKHDHITENDLKHRLEIEITKGVIDGMKERVRSH